MHAEVIDNDGQRLTLQWLREIQPDPSQSTKIVRVGPLNLLDADGDGGVELLVSHTAGEALPTYALLEIWTLGRDGPDLRWAQARGRFSTRSREELPLNASTSAADGLRTATTGDVDGDGHQDFFVVEPDGQREVL